MKKAMIAQMIIFVVAWALMTPDTIEDNTHLFGLIGSYDIIHGNSIWVMIGAGVLSVLNIWLWWPKAQGVVNTSSESSPAESTKSAKAEEKIDQDPKTPTLD